MKTHRKYYEIRILGIVFMLLFTFMSPLKAQIWLDNDIVIPSPNTGPFPINYTGVNWDPVRAAATVDVTYNVISGTGQQLERLKMSEVSTTQNINDSAFIAYNGTGTVVETYRIYGNGGVARMDFAFSSPLTCFDFVVFDIDDTGDKAIVEAFDATNTAVPNTGFSILMQGDMTSNGTGPDGVTPQINQAPPIVSYPTSTQIALTANSGSGYRNYTVLRYVSATPVSKISVTHDGTLTGTMSHIYVALRSIAAGSPDACAIGSPDLVLSKTVPNCGPYLPDSLVTFTIQVTNIGTADATNINVTDLLSTPFIFENATTTSSTYDETTGLWNIPSIAIGDTQTLTLTTRIAANDGGVFCNSAEITSLDQTDSDLTNNADNACVSLPVFYCNTDTINLLATAEAGHASYQWYFSSDGTTYAPILDATLDTLNITTVGYYKYTVDGASLDPACGGQLCCPIIVQTKICCPPPACIQVTLTRRKN